MTWTNDVRFFLSFVHQPQSYSTQIYRTFFLSTHFFCFCRCFLQLILHFFAFNRKEETEENEFTASVMASRLFDLSYSHQYIACVLIAEIVGQFSVSNINRWNDEWYVTSWRLWSENDHRTPHRIIRIVAEGNVRIFSLPSARACWYRNNKKLRSSAWGKKCEIRRANNRKSRPVG